MAVYDRAYRGILAATRFFSKGWGSPKAYQSLLDLFPCLNDGPQITSLLKGHTHPVTAEKVRDQSWGSQIAGSFKSPLATLCPHMLPEVATTARFELLLPKTWQTQDKPIYIHLAGTGDHAFWRRRHMTALPLLKDEGIGALLLENPFYGSRKPKGQLRSQLNHVSDLLVMGLSLILECIVLIGWLERAGFGPVGLTGISMGGHNASLTASVYPHPVPVVPCLSWSTAACVFTEGILSESVCWNVLEEQMSLCRKGYDEKLRAIFNIAVERQTSGMYCDLPSSEQQDWSSAHWKHKSHDLPQDTGFNSMFASHPTILPVRPRQYRSHAHREATSLMHAVLNSATHLSNFPSPTTPELALFITAQEDLYIPRHNVSDVRTMWPGCKVDYVPGGHVSSTVLQQAKFRSGLATTMGRVINRSTALS